MKSLVFIIGLVIGSFISLCIYRIPIGESISFPASHCDNCGQKLKIYELIPLISYVLYGGHCRSCKAKIPIIYPLIELVNGALYLIIFIKFGYSVVALEFSIFISIMITIGIIDFNTHFIYSSVTMTSLIIVEVFLFINLYKLGKLPVSNIEGCIFGLLLFEIIVKLTGAMGEGDIEVVSLCGLFLGLRYEILTIFLSFLLGGTSGYLMLKLKIFNQKDKIAFAPYLMLASIISVLFGDNIINWYLNFIY